MKSCNRAPTVLMATGQELVRSIVAQMVGNHADAHRVELVLPKTRLCRRLDPQVKEAAIECPVQTRAACCGKDEVAEDSGAAGRGPKQASAPLILGATLATWGTYAIWLMAGVGLLAAIALFLLRPG